MINQLKEYVQALNERERKLASIAVLVLCALVYYSLIWEPLHDSVVNLRQEIRKNQSLITWMQQAQTTLKTVKSGKENNNKRASSQSILTLTEQLIAKQQLSGNVKEIKQMDKNKVLVRFEDVAPSLLYK